MNHPNLAHTCARARTHNVRSFTLTSGQWGLCLFMTIDERNLRLRQKLGVNNAGTWNRFDGCDKFFHGRG